MTIRIRIDACDAEAGRFEVAAFGFLPTESDEPDYGVDLSAAQLAAVLGHEIVPGPACVGMTFLVGEQGHGAAPEVAAPVAPPLRRASVADVLFAGCV